LAAGPGSRVRIRETPTDPIDTRVADAFAHLSLSCGRTRRATRLDFDGTYMSAGERLPGTPVPMHRWLGAGNVYIAGDSWGDPDGPLVLLLHGGGQTRHAWKGAGETLGAAGYCAVAFDARGHGDSDWAPDGQYGQDLMVQDLECVVAAFGGRRPVLVGASMGGGTSLVAVGEDRIDATALVLVDVAPHIEAEGVEKIQAFMTRKPEGFSSLDEVADAIASYQPHRTRPRNVAGLGKNVRLGADGRYHWHWDPKFRAGRQVMEQRRERLEATRHPPSGPGTRPAAGASRTSTARSPAPRTRRTCRSAATRCSCIRWPRPTASRSR
jgi:pimeloyl-ACP methyl ester carboxylesterase